MCPNRFSIFSFITNAQGRIFESQRCLRTETVEELCDQIGTKVNAHGHDACISSKLHIHLVHKFMQITVQLKLS